jgi:small subunit ribosomal protein S18
MMMKKKTTSRRRGPRSDADEGARAPKRLEGVEHIDYKDAELLRRFMTERGKIMPCRTTYASAKQQRQIRKAIRRARVMGMLP